MQLRNTAMRYGAVPQAFHWITAVLVLLAWLLGTFGDDFPRGAARAAGLFAHITVGLAIIVLIVVRLMWRLGDPPPAIEKGVLGMWLDLVAKSTHWLLYALVVAAPLLGIAVQFARGNPLPVFGLFDIASPWAADRAFARSLKEVHETLANALLVLAGLHAAAALFHHWVMRDRTLVRMLPGGPK